MSRRDDRRKDSRRHRKGGADVCMDPEAIASQEKHRARELRSTSWWRKKTAAGICHYCGASVPPSELTMDHLIPISRGGTSERYNIVAACKDCNNRKKNLLPAEWDEYLKSIKIRTS